MGFSGRLEGIAPSDIFQIISQSRMTGTLIARCPDGTAMIVFKDGQVIEAASDAPQEALGHLLVSQGLMTEDVIRSAQERRKQEPERMLGEILVDMGAISDKTLQSVVLRQIERIVHRLVSCEDGFITFDRGEMALKRKLNTREFFLPAGVSTQYLMMERARTIDEERRTGPDRRRPSAQISVLEGDLAGDILAAAGKRGMTPKILRSPKERIHSFLHRTAAAARRVYEPAVRAAQRGLASSQMFIRTSLLPRLRAVGNKILAFSPDGKAMIVTGICGIVGGICLILLVTLNHGASKQALLVTGRVVNIRSTPSVGSKVVAQVERGDTVSSLAFRDGWHQVRTAKGEAGWVWKSLVQQKDEQGDNGGSDATGFALVVIAGVGLLAAGIARKRRTSSAAPSDPQAIR